MREIRILLDEEGGADKREYAVALSIDLVFRGVKCLDAPNAQGQPALAGGVHASLCHPEAYLKRTTTGAFPRFTAVRARRRSSNLMPRLGWTPELPRFEFSIINAGHWESGKEKKKKKQKVHGRSASSVFR